MKLKLELYGLYGVFHNTVCNWGIINDVPSVGSFPKVTQPHAITFTANKLWSFLILTTTHGFYLMCVSSLDVSIKTQGVFLGLQCCCFCCCCCWCGSIDLLSGKQSLTHQNSIFSNVNLIGWCQAVISLPHFSQSQHHFPPPTTLQFSVRSHPV